MFASASDSTLSHRSLGPESSQIRTRYEPIDVLRGVVVMLMVLDHVRYFLSNARGNPTDPAHTTVALFITRWLTHLCAPVFMLLAGAGARFMLERGRSISSLASFLVRRGAWLIFLEFTIARFGWQFNFDYSYSSALVFWALGWSMIALAALIWLPTRVVGVVAFGLILLHNLADRVEPSSWGKGAWLWTILHSPGTLSILGRATVEVVYPLIPWVGVMAAGYVVAPRLVLVQATSRWSILRVGVLIFLSGILLRFANVYGDPIPWTVQVDSVRTVLSFFNVAKYPPSLSYLLLTLGTAVALLGLLNLAQLGVSAPWWRRAAATVGRVPLFFWLLHVPLIHAVALGFSVFRYGYITAWLTSNPPTALPDAYGYPLYVIYVVSFAIVLVLYPACVWYSKVKERRPGGWLQYL